MSRCAKLWGPRRRRGPAVPRSASASSSAAAPSSRREGAASRRPRHCRSKVAAPLSPSSAIHMFLPSVLLRPLSLLLPRLSHLSPLSVSLLKPRCCICQGLTTPPVSGGRQSRRSPPFVRTRPAPSSVSARLTAAIPVDNPYCSFKLTRVRAALPAPTTPSHAHTTTSHTARTARTAITREPRVLLDKGPHTF